MPSRQLSDRIETYEDIIPGKCSCGEKVNKVLKSSCTMWVNGDRYHYPDNNTASCIFRCRNCREPIHETFIAEIIYIDAKGISHDISNTDLINDYLILKKIPSVNALLDWRSRLKFFKKDNKYPKTWYEKEIMATDFLLSKHNPAPVKIKSLCKIIP